MPRFFSPTLSENESYVSQNTRTICAPILFGRRIVAWKPALTVMERKETKVDAGG